MNFAEEAKDVKVSDYVQQPLSQFSLNKNINNFTCLQVYSQVQYCYIIPCH